MVKPVQQQVSGSPRQAMRAKAYRYSTQQAYAATNQLVDQRVQSAVFRGVCRGALIEVQVAVRDEAYQKEYRAAAR